MKTLLVQGDSQKLLLVAKESIVSNSIFSGPPCSSAHVEQDIYIRRFFVHPEKFWQFRSIIEDVYIRPCHSSG